MSNITETQYDEICRACDTLLNHRIRKDIRISNDWLHVIRFHPIFLNDYNDIFETNNSFKFYFFLFKKACFYLALSFKRILDIFGRKLIKEHNFEIDKNNYDSIFISHFLNNDFINNKKDFYFHELPKKFQNSKNKSLIVKINHSKTHSSLLNKEVKNLNILVLPENISILRELQISFFLFKEAIILLLKKTPKDVNIRIKLQSAIEFMSPASHFNLRIGKQIKSLVEQLKVKYVFTTFEGHAFERIIFSNARKSNKSIKCIGYQHALILKKQHAVKRKLGRNYDPDFILTSGNDGKKKLINSGFIKEKNIFLLGTNRTVKKNILFRQKRDTFLILPEGDFIECFPLIDLLFELAKILPSHHFIIRFHPFTDILKLKKEKVQLTKLPKNITLSQKSFEDDLKKSDYAIYRGSTTIIKAIQSGLVPIHYHKKGEQFIDPLFLLKKNKKNIQDPTDIYKIIKTNEEQNVKNLNVLVEGLKQFFSPLTYEGVLKLKKIKP